ncbi:MAG: crossover junction endodeoxyribonuclease RuvC [Deltaproteobacteria bacterium]|nr:crossover junction endodeoxyribonuclease RuvC [Deltaproteobacteria bacterium]MBW2076072.1 crossover junction endodeoxyribonuclease RuvC [Deltaproteobacteria bacterium]MBW2311799.1 crossover junction endodeoxyribonuclease RuvC [Deltaproteobacteria bacterium]RLB30960.1 MAG: crossover junction endodeoxyribonuclease RuvC [Deltaproteobacteria bacterium]
MLVLGVDPGSLTTGYGLVQKAGNRLIYVEGGKISLPSSAPFSQRIHNIFESLVEIIHTYHPEEMSIEDIFFAKNVKSALKIGHARGAILVAAIQCGLKVFEYTPLEIKQSVVGYGRATKEQVRSMVKLLLQLDIPLSFDTSDALAIAICHHNWVRIE